MSTVEPDPVEPSDAHDLAARGEAVIVDVREADAFAEGHPAGAVNIPISQLADRLGELPAGAPVFTSCGGGSRGPKAAAQLRDLGVDARVVRGGLRGWKGADLPVSDESP